MDIVRNPSGTYGNCRLACVNTVAEEGLLGGGQNVLESCTQPGSCKFKRTAWECDVRHVVEKGYGGQLGGAMFRMDGI